MSAMLDKNVVTIIPSIVNDTDRRSAEQLGGITLSLYTSDVLLESFQSMLLTTQNKYRPETLIMITCRNVLKSSQCLLYLMTPRKI